MSETADKHLEHAEHVQHAALNPLDRKIAMSMAIIAAFLAAASMISHRAHTETLRLTTEADIEHTNGSNMYNYYQFKNTLSRQYQVFLMMMDVIPVRSGSEGTLKKDQEHLTREIQKYEGTEGKEGSLAKLKEKAEEFKEKARKNEEASHRVHHAVNWIDYGHLGLELALVLCSIAVLTKQRGFWYTGIGAAVLGTALVLFGVTGLLHIGHL